MDASLQKEIFLAALDEAPENREAYVLRACGDDGELRAQVLRLLRSYERPPNFLGRPPREYLFPDSSENVEDWIVGKRIGRYLVRQALSSGGMGAVYLADQESPNRRVALKVMRPGMAGPAMLRRFEFEARVLGRLQHPGIAQIFDAGTADLGAGPQPYIVMEYVEGVPVTEFVERERLDSRDRIRLLIRICQAVQHAHNKGIIHRDLKPSNILVDASGQPKILDFGVARSIDPDLRHTSLRTRLGDIIGTLPYMSPEQIGGNPEEVDTRSDVHTLGTLGYQVLTGRLPYRIEGKSFLEAARIVCESEPETRSLGASPLAADLRAVFSKALEKDPRRRYQTAQEFASDLERFLQDEPVTAHADSAFDRARRFVRRNRALVLGAAVLFLVLLAGVVGTTWQARLAELRAQEAQVAKDRAVRLLSFLERVVAPPSARQPRSPDTTLKEALDQMAPSIARIRAADPETGAKLEELFDRAYRALGVHDRSE